MTSNFRLCAALIAASLCSLAHADHAGHCNGNDHVGTDIAAFNGINGGGTVNDFLGGDCLSAPQTVSANDSTASGSASVSSTTTAAWGLLTAHAVVNSASSLDYGVLAFYDSSQGEGDVARTLDGITALTDTQVRLTTVFDFKGSYSGSVTSTSQAFGSIVVAGIVAGIGHTDAGGPGGATHLVFSYDFFLPAGSTAYLIASLGADAEGSANALSSSFTGSATLDASYALSLQVLNAGGSLTALSGHDYLAPAVPEPAGWALMPGGLAALALARHRSAWHRRPSRSTPPRSGDTA
jgi:hypothetical protein